MDETCSGLETSDEDLATCSDIDVMSANSDGRFVHKDGTPYPGQ